MIGIKSLKADMTAHGGFKYPKRGRVEALDWNEKPKCGGGIHFLRPGDNNPGKWHGEKFIALDTLDSPVVALDGKAKCRYAKVLRVADSMADLCVWLQERGHNGPWFLGVATSGYGGTSTSGDYGTSTSGNGGTSTSGNGGTSTSGDRGTSTSGYRGTSTSGDWGTSTSGNWGTSTSGDYGTSTSGYGGTSTSGNRGRASAGMWGRITIQYYDGPRYRWASAEVDGDRIKPNVLYRVNNNGEFEEVEA